MSDDAEDTRAAEPQDRENATPEQGAPDDWEFHLDRVCARFPRTLSARRLAMLAELLRDDTPQ
jgi:hypothetical protein